MGKYRVASAGEILPGERKLVIVAGRSLGIFNIGGKFFALHNSCPHQGAPLCSGRLTGLLTATNPGAYNYSRQGEIIRCPWHQWEFDIVTGQSIINPRSVRARSFQVVVEKSCNDLSRANSDVNVPDPPHAIVESYPMSLDENDLFVEI